MGSGKYLKHAINKYGIENFSKEYLGIYDTENKMNLAERILVVIDSEVSYNLCIGGKGGFGYINNNLVDRSSLGKLGRIAADIKIQELYGTDWRSQFMLKGLEKAQRVNKERFENGAHGSFYGKTHSEESKEKMKKPRNIGENNSQFGTCWITNGSDNKKIKIDNFVYWVQFGYYRGRITINNK